MDNTSYESVPPDLLTKTRQQFYRLVRYTRNPRLAKEAIQKPVFHGLASATNALEARATKRLLRDVGSASSPTICPEGSVRLHELCKSCTSFTQRSVALSWLDDSNPHSDWPPRERYRLCTVAHLRRLNGHCHFCTVLYYFVSRLEPLCGLQVLDNGWLYLSIAHDHKPWEHGSMRLIASIDRGGSPPIMSFSYLYSSWVKMFDLCLLADQGAGDYVSALAMPAQVPLRSDDNTERVREWLEICLKDHTTCRRADGEAIALITRPERMLAINGDRVKLVCNWPESSGSKYLALSHMWGTDPKQQLRLVSSRLNEFQEDIPWTELPFIFKEAIRIARQVGYNHIWIDSLCIIQDSPSDWANEAGKMAHVYGHADCTIAYLLAPQDVLTKSRQDPRIWSPCIFRRPSLAFQGVYICPNIDEEISRKDRAFSRLSELDWLSPRNWPLFTRAWACQEYLLSSRILFLGHRNLMWECSELLCDELLGPMKRFLKATASKEHFSTVRSVTLPTTTISTQLEFVQSWGRLVRHYRAGALTQPKDRIMAFAGIAQAVHDTNGMTYLAGSWAQMFPFSFIWSVNSAWRAGITSHDSTITEVEAAIEAVPSWSWFSVPISSYDALTFEVAGVMDLSSHHISGIKKIVPIYQATLLSFEDGSQQAYIDPSTTNTFYNFTGMTLNLAMKTWSGFLEDSENLDHRCRRSINDQFQTLLGQCYGRLECKLDHRDEVHSQSDKVMTFGLLMEFRPEHKWKIEFIGWVPSLVGLIMQPDPSREAYKRIGLWTLYLYRYPVEWDAKNFDSVSIFDQLQGVRSEHIRLI